MTYISEWLFAVQDTILKIVEKDYPNDLHRWPLKQAFEGKCYACGDGYIYLLLRDNPTAQFPVINGDAISQLDLSDAPSDSPSLDNIGNWISSLSYKLALREQDAAVIIPYRVDFEHKTGKYIDDSWESWGVDEKKLWDYQIKSIVQKQFYFVRGLSMAGGFIIPPGYQFLSDECGRFLNDHPNYSKNVFIMTRFASGNVLLQELDIELRNTLRSYGLNPVRADDKTYPADRNLWNNVCAYMICCKMGIAILEDRVKDEFNPNVALEYGFMRALDKPTLLLADKNFRNLRADILGTLREEFDITDIKNTIRKPIEKWLRDLGLIAN